MELIKLNNEEVKEGLEITVIDGAIKEISMDSEKLGKKIYIRAGFDHLSVYRERPITFKFWFVKYEFLDQPVTRKFLLKGEAEKFHIDIAKEYGIEAELYGKECEVDEQ